MAYYFSTKLKNLTFKDAIARTTEALKSEGFGVLTDIDMKATLKSKLNIDFYNYKILGACNPSLAYNAIVQEKEKGIVEVTAVDPAASMQAVANEKLISVAHTVSEKLKKVIQKIQVND